MPRAKNTYKGMTFEEIHSVGARRFRYWITMNMAIIDATRECGMDPTTPLGRLHCSAVAFAALAEQEEQQELGGLHTMIVRVGGEERRVTGDWRCLQIVYEAMTIGGTPDSSIRYVTQGGTAETSAAEFFSNEQ